MAATSCGSATSPLITIASPPAATIVAATSSAWGALARWLTTTLYPCWAIAIALAQQGYKVVVNHRASAPQAEDVAATIVAAGGEAMVIKGDVAEPHDVAAMGDEINKQGGEADVLGHT